MRIPHVLIILIAEKVLNHFVFVPIACSCLFRAPRILARHVEPLMRRAKLVRCYSINVVPPLPIVHLHHFPLAIALSDNTASVMRPITDMPVLCAGRLCR